MLIASWRPLMRAAIASFASTDTIRNRDGERFPVSANINASLFAAGFAHVTTKKILGGHYGFSVLLAGANNRIQGTEIDQDRVLPGERERHFRPDRKHTILAPHEDGRQTLATGF